MDTNNAYYIAEGISYDLNKYSLHFMQYFSWQIGKQHRWSRQSNPIAATDETCRNKKGNPQRKMGEEQQKEKIRKQKCRTWGGRETPDSKNGWAQMISVAVVTVLLPRPLIRNC